MWTELVQTPLFGIGLTLVVYLLAQILYRRVNSVWANPVLVAIVAIILLLKGAGIDYHDYARALLQDRRGRALPPFGSLAVVRSDCADAGAGEQFLAELRRELEGLLPDDVQLIGPLPAPMQRRAGRFRSQLLLHAPRREALHSAARTLVERGTRRKATRGLNWSVDIDPLELS